MEEGSNIVRLPEELLKQVIIRTSPKEASRCSLVCCFLSDVAQSDAVWEHFLPSDVPSIFDRPVQHSSKKELYLLLSDPNKNISIDNGCAIFGLERSTGAKCYTLSSRLLNIEHGDKPENWTWSPHPSSRFNEVAQLRVVYWFDIQGSIASAKLSANTKYAAYFLFKLATNATGLNSTKMQALITIGEGDSKTEIASFVRLAENQLAPNTGAVRYGSVRKDGWLEIGIGEFYNGEGRDTCVMFRLSDTDTTYRKVGLVVEGMELRPKI